jgi:hypothetical protein
MLGVTGKDEARIRELLLRGSLVSGASRFRWTGWDAGLENLRELLATFPDPDPSRPFAAAIARAPPARRPPAHRDCARSRARKGLFQRESFWDALMKVIAGAGPAYAGYSYRERADRYLREFTTPNSGKSAPPAAWCATRFSERPDPHGGVHASRNST